MYLERILVVHVSRIFQEKGGIPEISTKGWNGDHCSVDLSIKAPSNRTHCEIERPPDQGLVVSGYFDKGQLMLVDIVRDDISVSDDTPTSVGVFHVGDGGI
jgi:hypothetical protein